VTLTELPATEEQQRLRADLEALGSVLNFCLFGTVLLPRERRAVVIGASSTD
jgi:hypothetical protein